MVKSCAVERGRILLARGGVDLSYKTPSKAPTRTLANNTWTGQNFTSEGIKQTIKTISSMDSSNQLSFLRASDGPLSHPPLSSPHLPRRGNPTSRDFRTSELDSHSHFHSHSFFESWTQLKRRPLTSTTLSISLRLCFG